MFILEDRKDYLPSSNSFTDVEMGHEYQEKNCFVAVLQP